MFTKFRMLTAVACLAVVLTLCGGAGCARSTQSQSAQSGNNAQATAQPTTPKRFTAADLAKLRWIEGSWRGTGDVETPFYERYYFENDRTLVVEGLADETSGRVTDVTKFELRDGQFGNWGEGSRWAATEISDDSIKFEPTVRARNSFRWQRESKDLWKATLDYPANGGNPARQRVYRMERITTVK